MLRILVLLVLAAFFTACDPSHDSENLNVLAGSELKDLAPLFGEIEKNTGLKLVMEYSGTLDGAEKLNAGQAVDLAWFSHGKYITLAQGDKKRILAQEKIMLSPVVMGVKASAARAWGWVDNPKLTWRDIAAKAETGELRYAMADPTASNSGFTALVGVAAAFAGEGDALRAEDIDQKAIGSFFKGQRLTAGSSGWLADAYLAGQNRLNGIINYESVLMALNKNPNLQEKLVLVYPKEGIITADYPLMLVNGQKRDRYDKLVAYLKSPAFQQAMMEQTLRRPVIPQVKLSQEFGSKLLVELPFPNDLATIDQLLFAYQDKHRLPSHTFFVLDISGSMQNYGRMAALHEALKSLTGLDQSLAGRFTRFRSREKLTFIPFDNLVYPPTTLSIDNPDSQGPDMSAVRQYIDDSLLPKGGTAIYSALKQAYQLASKAKQAEPDRLYSIVLMTDGENNDGITEQDFARYLADLNNDAEIKTFTILFGDANKDKMVQLAALTGGASFDGRTALAKAFKTIRGYQ